MTAFREQQTRAIRWTFAGQLQDNLLFDGQCAFCGKPDLRVTFVLSEVTEGGTCQICQECMSHRQIGVEQEGRSLEGKERKDFLGRLSVHLALRSCRDVLRQLLACTEAAALRDAAVYFDRNVQFSPAHAATVVAALTDAKLGVDPRIFEVRMRSVAHRQEFGRLGRRQQLLVWPLLSLAVQDRLVRLGLTGQDDPSRRPRRGYAGSPRSVAAELRAE